MKLVSLKDIATALGLNDHSGIRKLFTHEQWLEVGGKGGVLPEVLEEVKKKLAKERVIKDRDRRAPGLHKKALNYPANAETAIDLIIEQSELIVELRVEHGKKIDELILLVQKLTENSRPDLYIVPSKDVLP